MLKLVAPPALPPNHVCILGLGPSVASYMDLTRRLGGRRRLCDETWAINALGDVFACDRVFHMDDVRIQQIRVDAAPQSNIGVMLDWMKTHPGPIYTSRPHPDYPGMVQYPLQDVINDLGVPYFNSTAAYAIALAIHMGVKIISLFGIDFTYANAHHAEKGRACVEFWLGLAQARDIEIRISDRSSLMDMCEPGSQLYGFGAMGSLDVAIEEIDAGDGRTSAKVTFTPRETLPTAEEIEAAYDHTRHPSPLMSGAAA